MAAGFLASAVRHQAAAAVRPGYVIGIIVASLLMCYLIYSLIKPEKF